LNRSSDGLPIRLFLTSDMMPDIETISQLKNLANVPVLDHHVAVLPDVHRKGRNLGPTGTVVAAKNCIVPRAVDAGINCGMRMIGTDIDACDLTVTVLDRIFNGIMRAMPPGKHDQDLLSDDEIADILVHGGKWSRERFGLGDAELNCIENGATYPMDTEDRETILGSIPKKAIKKGRRSFCTIGGGNHFLELQEIIEVLEPETANRLGLYQGKAFFMLHTGACKVSKKMVKTYLDEFENKFFPQRSGGNGPSLWSVPADSEEGLIFARALAAVSNVGFANRIAITEKLRGLVREVLHDSSLSMPLLYDCAHVSIKSEEWNGDRLWVHRHGASPALPPSRLAGHPVFCTTGQPVPIPGSMGDDSFVGVADEGAVETFYSVNHGAGRLMDKPEAIARFTESQVEKEMREKNIRLYRYGSDNIAEQAPGSFKDISQVVRAMSVLSLARPVVRLRPLAVLKG
jgi:tRNA-splicing ligase RtcB